MTDTPQDRETGSGIVLTLQKRRLRQILWALITLHVTGVHVQQTVQTLPLGRLLNLASILAVTAILCDADDEAAITAAANKVMPRPAQPFVLNGIEVLATASVGVAVYPRDSADNETLLKNADLALYRAKEAGRNAFRLFRPRNERECG